jgi:hypothetical protein
MIAARNKGVLPLHQDFTSFSTCSPPRNTNYQSNQNTRGSDYQGRQSNCGSPSPSYNTNCNNKSPSRGPNPLPSILRNNIPQTQALKANLSNIPPRTALPLQSTLQQQINLSAQDGHFAYLVPTPTNHIHLHAHDLDFYLDTFKASPTIKLKLE